MIMTTNAYHQTVKSVLSTTGVDNNQCMLYTGAKYTRRKTMGSRSQANHSTHHWCPAHRKWVLKKDALDSNHGKVCPVCKEKGNTVRLRTRSRKSRSQRSVNNEWLASEPRVPVEAK